MLLVLVHNSSQRVFNHWEIIADLYNQIKYKVLGTQVLKEVITELTR